ncbi:MAG: MFS transporter [Marinosulfonomonas sp.]|nr:MFS transporter [Marinosulfonomonas sp.]
MFDVLKTSWALLLGMLLLMVGNGVQGTLLGIRGNIEGFSTLEMSIVMSAYFAGFFGGSRVAPELIRRVGHVRVFAALGSFISAVLILYPSITEPWAWALLRVIIGFCFSGVYVTAESWLNHAATNENRGQTLSLYMIVQMAGVVAAQGLLVLGDPSGFVLFVIPSVLVSISFAPILLSVNPTPAFETTKPMRLRDIYAVSPLGCVGLFLLGGVFGAQFGMSAVYAAQLGLPVGQISVFIATIYVGALVAQFPIGWLSDRMDRRALVLIVAAVGGIASMFGLFLGDVFGALIVLAFIVGGASNPLYSLLIAHTNDYLEPEDMAAASGGLIFINGMGAITGPLITGWLIGQVGPAGYWLFIGALMVALVGYALFRMTQRPAMAAQDTGAYVTVMPSASTVTLEAAQEYSIEAAEETMTDETEA